MTESDFGAKLLAVLNRIAEGIDRATRDKTEPKIRHYDQSPESGHGEGQTLRRPRVSARDK